MIYMARIEDQGSEGPVRSRQREHDCGRALLELGLFHQGIDRMPELILEEHGKPVFKDLPGLCFNISHTEGLAVCAVSSHPIGVDTERIRPLNIRLLRKICSEAEGAWVMSRENPAEGLIRLWTLKESYVKATGEGLSYSLKQITFSWDEDGSIRGSIPGWHYYQARVYGKYIISVCEKDQEGEQQ